MLRTLLLVIAVGVALPGAAQARPQLSITDGSTVEGTCNECSYQFSHIIFQLRLSEPSDQRITVTFESADGTAVAEDENDVRDYSAQRSDWAFDPGQTVLEWGAGVYKDPYPESDERFYIRITNASDNVDIADGEGVMTIIDDDTPPPPPKTCPLMRVGLALVSKPYKVCL